MTLYVFPMNNNAYLFGIAAHVTKVLFISYFAVKLNRQAYPPHLNTDTIISL